MEVFSFVSDWIWTSRLPKYSSKQSNCLSVDHANDAISGSQVPEIKELLHTKKNMLILDWPTGLDRAQRLSQYRSVLLKSPKSAILAQEYRFRDAV